MPLGFPRRPPPEFPRHPLPEFSRCQLSHKATKIRNDIRKKAGFYGQTRGRVSRTEVDCGLTDKRGLRFTDRRSSDFPDTCHLDFQDALHLNFPDASYLTKQPKSGITNSAQKTSAAEKWSNLQTSWRFVVKKMLGRKWEQCIHIILRQSQYTADLTIGRTEIIVQFLGKVKFLWTCQVM